MIGARFEFSVDPVQQFQYVRGSMSNKAMRIALSSGASVVKAASESMAPQGTGALKASLRIRTRYYKAKAIWVAIVGVASRFTRGRGKKKLQPSRYATYVERGTEHNRAHPYLQPALTATHQAFVAKVKSKLAEELQKAFAKG